MQLTHDTQYSLHLLGWKAFQDLAIALAEECLQRPVQTFLATNDAGRDGAFVGKWQGDHPSAGESTIQCKFTSKPNNNLTKSMLEDEVDKARLLAERGLAHDYVIITNHSVTGQSDLKIKKMFEDVGVGRCRIFGNDWIVRQILNSPKLRMMAPRLYGMGDLSSLMDERAYEQASLIISSMGDDLQRLVVTEAHRSSVRAVSRHNLVVLLGPPAAGKSTIGASLAVGAADIWGSMTIRATHPSDIQKHLDPGTKQFFWIDDAWGSTQYQKQRTEEWNHVLPLIRAGINQGSRFLFTSRDYIWNSAVKDLKVQALPLLSKSQVIIDVYDLTTQEKSQILYNHIKMGDQSQEFRTELKAFLPTVAESKSFLPEVARRLGSTFFVDGPLTTQEEVISFFEKPSDFLLDTISNLSASCRAAIAVVFLNGGSVSSPIESELLQDAATAFGVTPSEVRDAAGSLNGSLLLLLQLDEGPAWTYKHPTISDAFASYLAASAELTETYLRGAKPASIVWEVVCSGQLVAGASVVVPETMLELLADRIEALERYRLVSFLSYRANAKFCKIMLDRRPDILGRLTSFHAPIKDDIDTDLVVSLFEFGLLPDENRRYFADSVRDAVLENADASLFMEDRIASVLNQKERLSILDLIKNEVAPKISNYADELMQDWQNDSDPDQFFDELELSIETLMEAASASEVMSTLRSTISDHIWDMQQNYEPVSSTSAPVQNSSSNASSVIQLFRDIDE